MKNSVKFMINGVLVVSTVFLIILLSKKISGLVIDIHYRYTEHQVNILMSLAVITLVCFCFGIIFCVYGFPFLRKIEKGYVRLNKKTGAVEHVYKKTEYLWRWSKVCMGYKFIYAPKEEVPREDEFEIILDKIKFKIALEVEDYATLNINMTEALYKLSKWKPFIRIIILSVLFNDGFLEDLNNKLLSKKTDADKQHEFIDIINVNLFDKLKLLGIKLTKISDFSFVNLNKIKILS